MVDSLFGLSNRGLRDWIVQRISAVILLLYTLTLLGFIIFHPQLQFDEWQSLFSSTWMKIFSLLVLTSLILHAWVGMWTVFTDYIKCYYLSFLLQIGIILLFFCCLVWGVVVLWGI